MQSELVGRAQGGDAEAFDALAGAAYDRLYSLAYRILRDPERAKDAVQECLVRAWRDIRGLRDPDRFDAWLHRLIINACYDEARRRRTRAHEVHLLPLERAAPGRPIDDLIDRDELDRGFRRLPVEHRAVLVMHHYLGLRLPEIAAILGVPEGTVRSRLHYATGAMRAVLEADARPALVAEGGRTA
jgi:RNA polymerase sigma-70 factor (ECF subfamily)